MKRSKSLGSIADVVRTSRRLLGIVWHEDKRLLVASHIKPWRDATNDERLDGNNGFLMSPHVDKLFDRGWISFADDGRILIGDRNIRSILSTWAIDGNKRVGTFSKYQKGYLEYHRDKVLKK